MGCLLTTVVEDLNYKGASPSNRAVDINPEDRKCSCLKMLLQQFFMDLEASGVILITTKKGKKGEIINYI
jgi:hypothetical protein